LRTFSIAASRSLLWVTSKVWSNAARAEAGRWSISATWPTSTMSIFGWPAVPKMPPKSTRNISGNTIAKKTADRSRRKPLRIARDSERNARSRALVEVLMRGTRGR
jgi:hypothetical protein